MPVTAQVHRMQEHTTQVEVDAELRAALEADGVTIVRPRSSIGDEAHGLWEDADCSGVIKPTPPLEAAARETSIGRSIGSHATSITSRLSRSFFRISTSRRASGIGGSASMERTRTSEEMSPEVSNIVTFRDSELALRRASTVSSVLRQGARVLTNHQGSAETYRLSEQVLSIDVFFSHNWVVGRMKKFLCLILYFNLRFAILAALAAMIVASVATSLDIRPLVVVSSSAKSEYSLNATLLVAPVFLFAACFGHDLKRIVGVTGCTIFLDKTCIHQTDKEIQRAGILKLGAFLRDSSHMVIVYTDVYLRKLWTVYEIACFLSQHPISHLTILPTFLPAIVFGGVSVYYLGFILDLVLKKLLGLEFTQYITKTLLLPFLGAVILRHWARAKELFQKRVAHFRVQECICFCEEDRSVVYQNIASLMRAIGRVGADDAEEVALESFNSFVRKSFSTILEISAGPLGMRYLHVVAIFLCVVLPRSIDKYLLGVHTHYPGDWDLRFRSFLVAADVGWVFGFYPLATAALSLWCGRCIRLRGCAEWMFVALGVVLVGALGYVLDEYIGELAWMSVEEGPRRDATSIGFALLLTSVCAAAIAAYTWRRRPEEAREEGEAPETRGVAKAVDLAAMEDEAALAEVEDG